jgi:phosphocarrier protein HPr
MTDPATASPAIPRLSQDVPITNKKGLHARASAHFVRCAEQFDATVTVAKEQSTVGGTSIMGLMMLSAGQGSVIRITTEGADAAAALAALVALVAGRFGEEE